MFVSKFSVIHQSTARLLFQVPQCEKRLTEKKNPRISLALKVTQR